jgi:hypothetical protein
VDSHVQEHAARDLDVGDRRRRRIAADDVQQGGLADLAAPDRIMNPTEVGVEAAIEADLQLDAGPVGRGQRAVDLGQRMGNGLFAKDVLARVGCLFDETRMGVGPGADQHCIDCRVAQHVAVVGGGVRYLELIGKLLGGGCVDVRHSQQLCCWNAIGQRCGMHLADAPRADQADVQCVHHEDTLDFFKISLLLRPLRTERLRKSPHQG